MMNRMIYLASRSPRRKALLQQLGLEFEIRVVDIDEGQKPSEKIDVFVQRLALEKAWAAKNHFGIGENDFVIGADTVVTLDGDVMGKPNDFSHAQQMLSALSGRQHQVLTAVCVIGKQEKTALSASEVSFRKIQSHEIDAYWASGEPRDKAGAYAIQGWGAVFVRNLSGSYSGVMGLPLYETAELLRSAGVELTPKKASE